MKNNTIQVRLSDELYHQVQSDCLKAGMNQSTYLRSLITGSKIKEPGAQREIMEHVCRMYTIVNNMAGTEDVEDLRKEMRKLCRCLNQ